MSNFLLSAFRSFYSHHSSIVLLFDIDSLCIIEANPEACKFYGYSEDEMRGMAIRQIYFESEYQSFVELFSNKAIDNSDIKSQHIKYNGELAEVSMQITAIDASTSPCYKLFTVTELISPELSVQMELSAKHRLDCIIEGTNVGTWEWNIQTGKTIYNERWAEIIGYTLAELSPVSINTWTQMAHPDDLLKSADLLQKHFDGETEFYEFESRMKHKNGDWIWVLDRGKLINRDEEGKPLKMYGSHQDITQKKQFEIQLLRNSKELDELNSELLFEVKARKIVEEILVEREENFTSLFEAIEDLIIIATPEGNILFVNNKLPTKLGLSKEELLKMHVLELHPEEYRKEAEEIFGAMFKGERDYCPLPLQIKSGGYFPVETRIWLGKWNGKDCVFGVSKDLSKQQAALDKFRKLFDNNPALMAVSEMPGRTFTEVNQAFLEKLGYSKEELIGKTATELNLFIESEKQIRITDELEKTGRIRDVELQVRHKNGSIIQGMFSGEILNNQGELSFLTVMLDVSEERKQSELIDKFFDVGLDLFCIANTDGYFLKLNKAWERTLGYTQDELMSKQFLEFVHPDDLQSTMDAISDLSAQHTILNFRNRFKSKDGSYKNIEWRSYPVNNLIYAAARDITERLVIEENMKISESYLRAIIENQPGLVWLKDSEGKFLTINQAFADA